jgi:hypothetical protein
MSEPRRFPPPWSVDDSDMKLGQECFTVRDGNGHALACVYFEEEPGRRAAAKLLTRDEARRIAANIAKLSELLRIDRGASARKLGAELDFKSTELDQYCPKCDGARDPLKPKLAHQQKSMSRKMAPWCSTKDTRLAFPKLRQVDVTTGT